MSMDLTGIVNQNEYYTNHYFASIFEENAADTISAWRAEAKDSEDIRTPWSLLRDNAKLFYVLHDRYIRSRFDLQTLQNIQALADGYMESLGYPPAKPENIAIDDTLTVPVYLELTKSNGAPLLWIVLAASSDETAGILESHAVFTDKIQEGEPTSAVTKDLLTDITNEDLATKALFSPSDPPRFLLFIGMNQLALIDRNKWNEKRYLQFELEDIFSRREESTLQAMAVLLHKNSLCPEEGTPLLDELDSNSQKHAAGVSQDLKYALRESIELLGNEVLYDMKTRQGIDLRTTPVDAGELTIECLRYMYRMLFVLFIEARPELGYAPIKDQSYLTGYSLESLRDIADAVRDDVDEVGEGYYLHDTLAKLYELIYTGYPESEEDLLKYSAEESLHDMFVISPLKAHIFDPEYTKLITNAKIRNKVMLQIVELMSLTRATGKKNARRGRISYANLGINQLGAVYEALLSYRGFIAEEDLYEVKRAGDKFNELDVGYFVKEHELSQYTEDERVRYETGENKGKLRMYKQGSFIYRLAGREREKSASYYTPEVLTKCLVKYALKELLEGKTADEILQLTVCEPAMGSAAFLNEAINQLAEAYLDRKQKELGETISHEKRFNELQKVKMYIADRNVYGIDLNPVAVELAEVSLWLNTIFKGGFVPWFSTQLINGNSLIGARRQCYRIEQAQTTVKGMRWYENAPERLPFTEKRADKGFKFGRKQIYHFLLGDPGMCDYTDKVIKSLEPENIKKMKDWNKKFTAPIDDDDVVTLLRLSAAIDELWDAQVKLRKEVEAKTQDKLSVYGHADDTEDSHTTIRQKDSIYSELYKSEHMRNAGPYARLKFAMDYWCALWFWPVDKADLLPTRSEFLFDMSMILEGTIASVNVSDTVKGGQLSLFATEMEQMAMDIIETYGTNTIVDIPALRQQTPRLDLAAQIAEQNHFMHWELEFADLFAERGGFDLVIGNPPWVKIAWNEQNVLSEQNPKFAVKEMTATTTAQERAIAISNTQMYKAYFSEFEELAGQQSFFCATQNYIDLKGQQTNLYKCFLPQAWSFSSKDGISAFIHPNGLYDDPKGGVLREKVYPRLRYHFHFLNEKVLFDISHTRTYSLNVYGKEQSIGFYHISNLFEPATIENCFDASIKGIVPGLKAHGEWVTSGHPDRNITIDARTLKLFYNLFGGGETWRQTILPVIHSTQVLHVLSQFSAQGKTMESFGEKVFSTIVLDETQAQQKQYIERNVQFPDGPKNSVYSGPHIYVGNPLAKTSRRKCVKNGDFDPIDLEFVSSNYIQRLNYSAGKESAKLQSQMVRTPWGTPYSDEYKLILRRMLSIGGERTLISAIIPAGSLHINTLTGAVFQSPIDLVYVSALMASVPFDAYIKVLNRTDLYYDSFRKLPCAERSLSNEIIPRYLGLNALTTDYAPLYEKVWNTVYSNCRWSTITKVRADYYVTLTGSWNTSVAFRSDFERRQAMLEIDVLVSMELGMTLDDLKTLYRILFPVLQQNEADTWYDSNGRIVFTNNRSLVGVGFTRPEFENPNAVTPIQCGDAPWDGIMKHAPAGYVFARTITDDTMPGGPIQRTIEYVAPFDRCDREQDYETAWKFFEEKYGKENRK